MLRTTSHASSLKTFLAFLPHMTRGIGSCFSWGRGSLGVVCGGVLGAVGLGSTYGAGALGSLRGGGLGSLRTGGIGVLDSGAPGRLADRLLRALR